MKWANSLPKNTLIKKKTEAENLFRKIGITFSVYNNYDASERLLPFDLFPRVITHNKCIDDKYVRISCGLDFLDASTIKGVKTNYSGSENLKVKVSISNCQ